MLYNFKWYPSKSRDFLFWWSPVYLFFFCSFGILLKKSLPMPRPLYIFSRRFMVAVYKSWVNFCVWGEESQGYIFQNKNPAIPETFFLEGKKGEGFRNKNNAFILYFLVWIYKLFYCLHVWFGYKYLSLLSKIHCILYWICIKFFM